MSGEFRELYGRASFLWCALADADELESGRHDVSICLQDIYRALAPIERGCAWFEACDSDASAPVMALVEHWPALSTAIKRLDNLRGQYLAIIAAAVAERDHEERRTDDNSTPGSAT